MDDQYWDALTNRIQSAETFLRKSCYSHTPDLLERDIQQVPSQESLAESDAGAGFAVSQGSGMTPRVQVHPNTFEQLTTTIEDGRIGYKNLVQINNIAILMGPVLIGLSALSGIALQNGTITLIFGLLGVSVLIATFLLKPAEEIRVALANLIQAETVSMDFYNQVQFWAPYARESANTEERQQASRALHEATTFALEALHDFVEPSGRDLKIKEL